MLHWFGKRLRHMQEVPRDERGFTLIELLVVVIIIGILAAIAIPTFLGQRQRAFNAEAQTSARTAATAAKTFYVDNQTYDGMTVAALNTIEPTLPATANGAPFNGTGGIYTVAETDTNFTITVRHPQGNLTYVSNDSGTDNGTP